MINAIKKFSIILCLLGYTYASDAGVCYVSTSGSAQNSGGSWSESLTLNYALDLPIWCSEIWVKEGVYFPGPNRSDSFVVEPGIKLYGGFVGHETTRDQRDPLNHKSTLSGQIGMSSNTDNSINVVSILPNVLPSTEKTILDGFIVKGGYANLLVVAVFNAT